MIRSLISDLMIMRLLCLLPSPLGLGSIFYNYYFALQMHICRLFLCVSLCKRWWKMQVLYMLGDIKSGPAYKFTQWLELVRKRSSQYRNPGLSNEPRRISSMPFLRLVIYSWIEEILMLLKSSFLYLRSYDYFLKTKCYCVDY